MGNGWIKYTGDVTTSGNASGFRINVTSGYTNLYIDNVEVYPYISDTEVGDTNYISDPGFTNLSVATAVE